MELYTQELEGAFGDVHWSDDREGLEGREGRAPSIAPIVAASALLGAVLQMCAEGNSSAAAAAAGAAGIPQEDELDEPVVEFKKLVDLGTRVWYRVPDMLSKAQEAHDEDDEDAGGEDAGLSILAMRGASDDPFKTDLRALAAVLAAYGAYGSGKRGPLFGCLASTVCRRLLLSLNNKEEKKYDLVSAAHRYMRGARSNSRVWNPLDAIIKELDGDPDVTRLVVDAQAMAKLVHNVVPH